MRQNLLYTFLLLGTVSAASVTYAQNDRFAFAITDLQQTGAGWNALRKLDLNTGAFSQVLLNGTDANMITFDATSKKAYKTLVDAKFAANIQAPFTTGVAAMAYDKKNNRLYFTPMFVDQLRYLDLKTMKVYYVTDQPFTKFGNMHNDEGKVISRMVIAPDGTGYAISNDANTFIRFTTGKKLQITQLGSLVDDPSNGEISIHNKCSCWGGDMICDDAGGLYIITARNSIFKVDMDTKAAKLIGYIKGLPQDFTSNGAVVTPEGKVLVSSAVNGNGYFLVDPKDWSATLYPAAAGVFRSSDLANSNYLQTKSRNTTTEAITTVISPDNNRPVKILVYPNPVSNNQFTLQFGKITPGNYNMELTDVMGRVVMQRKVSVMAEDQVEVFSINASMARGVYLVKVINTDNKSMLSEKLVVQ